MEEWDVVVLTRPSVLQLKSDRLVEGYVKAGAFLCGLLIGGPWAWVRVIFPLEKMCVASITF